MNLFNDVKCSGVELLVQYHPIVLDFKKKSKKLHKEVKIKGFSLMQCQELVAKQNGFNNWHHFMSIIKNQYQKELDNKVFLVSKEPFLENNKSLLLGHDLLFNNYGY